MRILIVHITFLFVFTSLSKAQPKNISFDEMAAIMLKANSTYQQKEYHVAIEIFTYKGHFAFQPEDYSKGFINKKNNLTEQYQLGVYSLQNNDLKVMIDSSDNVIGITFPDTSSFAFSLDSNFIKNFNRHVSKVTLTNNPNEAQFMEIFYKHGFPYEKINIKINNSFVEEIVFFYADAIEYEDENEKILKDKPKLRVVLKKLPPNQKFKFNLADIIIKTNKNYQLADKFKSFELIDFRYNN